MNELTDVWFAMCLSSGGLAEEVDEKVLHAAFIPFGDIIDIQIPLDYETGAVLSLLCVFDSLQLNNPEPSLSHRSCVRFTEKHRGFAFIEFELAEVRAFYLRPLFGGTPWIKNHFSAIVQFYLMYVLFGNNLTFTLIKKKKPSH